MKRIKSLLSGVRLYFEQSPKEPAEPTPDPAIPGVHRRCLGRGYSLVYAGRSDPVLFWCTCPQAIALKKMLADATDEGYLKALKAIRRLHKSNRYREARAFVEDEIRKQEGAKQ